MTDINRLKEIINNRTVAICLHGKSIEQLENYIEIFAEKDICWTALGLFTVFEIHILSKIKKKLDIVFDCATVPHRRLEHYELLHRFPRIVEFLERPDDNLWITSHGLIRDSVNPLKSDILQYENKIMLVDSIFPRDEIPKWMDVPNSVTLLIASALAGGAKKIIIFGLDGYTGGLSKGLDFYYRKNEAMMERLAALGKEVDPGINRDSLGFEERFPQILSNYRQLFKNDCEIINVSPESMYTVIQKANYNDLGEIINE